MNNKSMQGLVSYCSGHAAEETAKKWLEEKGYTFIAQNVKGMRGLGVCELDLVMKDKKTLVFIEVKKRKTTENALQAVLPSTCKRLYKGAEVFLAQNPQYQGLTYRFDVICFDNENKITHLKNVIEQ